jgi:magnesium chelatase family protein
VHKAKQQKKLRELTQRDHSLNGGILEGLEGQFVEVQGRALEALRKPCSVARATEISGMASDSVKEAQVRIAGAFAKLGIPDSDVAILINLAPSALYKHGAWLDLPIAIVMLQAAGHLPDLPEHLEGDYLLFGEIGIHGEIRRVPGALSLAYKAVPGQKLIVPSGNEKECALIMAKPGHEACGVYPVNSLQEVIDFFKGSRTLENVLSTKPKFESQIPRAVDFGRIRGQDKAKRAAVIAAAGGHNMLLIGPPGEGKSMIASAIPGILPKLKDANKVELTRIYSACGELKGDGSAITRRPFRNVHHSATTVSVVGGGRIPRPGQVTLAHLGVLFLDELAEFDRDTLESLRQPMEAGEVHITRHHSNATFPSRFTLVAATNPCPCGYFGYDGCTCTDSQVLRYQSRISGPIFDRIDLKVDVVPLTVDEKFEDVSDGESPRLRKMVQKARDIQQERFAEWDIPFNGAIPGGRVAEFCQFTPTAFEHYKEVIQAELLSTRSSDRLAKVARTIADLEGGKQIGVKHIDEAAMFVAGGTFKDAFE